MTRRVLAVVAVFGGLTGICGCAAPQAAETAATTKDDHTPRPSPALNELRSLAGEWEMTDKDGKRTTAAVFRVVASGSAVVQTMFPGSEHEMVNMYHMDGDKVVVTHYCAIGNQPRMVSGAPVNGVYRFKLDRVSNLSDRAGAYMGELTLTVKGRDAYSENWGHFKDGKMSDHGPVFEYTRKK